MKTPLLYHSCRVKQALLVLLFFAIFNANENAQIVFSVSDMQNHVGQYRVEYIATNQDISGWIGTSGGPQVWDFSGSPGPMDVTQRTDIVWPNDAQNESGVITPGWTNFANATFAERVTASILTNLTWTFYSITNGQGVWNYGDFTRVTNEPSGPMDTFVVFEPPVFLLPDPVQVGESWTNATALTNFIVEMPTLLDFVTYAASSNYADAYGTVILPQIGPVPAVRYIEWYTATNELFGIYLSSVAVTYYTWLVRGIGPAVVITVPEDLSVGIPATTNTLARVFEFSPRPAANLQIQTRNSSVTLNWNAASDTSGYEVESSTNLLDPNWQLLGSINSNSWSQAFAPFLPQQFFRVVLEP